MHQSVYFSRFISAGDFISLVKLRSPSTVGFAVRMHAEAGEFFVENERRASLGHSQPQIIIHRINQRFIERADAFAEISPPENRRLADHVGAKQRSHAVTPQ